MCEMLAKIILKSLALLGLLGLVYGDPGPEFLLQSQTLPEDLNFMPSLANGHLGYTVFGDSIYMNGVYNGGLGNSRRARMPNWLNISAEVCNKLECISSTNGATYEMDLRNGYFRQRNIFPSLGVELEQRTYPHRYYTRALVYELVATRTAAIPEKAARVTSPLYLKLYQQPGADSDAFDFVTVDAGTQPGAYRTLRGRTRIIEHEHFQNESREIFVIFSENFDGDVSIDWPNWKPELRYSFIISADLAADVAQKELTDVLKLTPEELLEKHTQVWQQFWDEQFAVEIDGDLELWRIVNAGIFYLASSLPALSSNQPNNAYYGLSPTGLARGHLDADYEGHSFWDTEIWMLPAISQFSYEWAQQILGYRHNVLSGAQYNANATGYKGARFPWESAYTGTEVTNPCCPEVAEHEVHISPDIVFALEKFFAQSNDRAWLCKIAWPLSEQIAEFITSRVTCRKEVCHIENVMGPDEDHVSVNDNVYTNVISQRALEFTAFAAGICGNDSHHTKIVQWREIAEKLLILYDEQLDYHPQHDGYTIGETIKQADTILLGYPLQFPMNKTTQLNDLATYAQVTRDSGPAMTWSMFAINYLMTAQDWRAHEYFERGYKHYVRPEFKAWSENRIGYAGSANFLTGIGGFLQALISGYGGINYARDGNKVVFEIRSGMLPPNVTRLKIKTIKFTKNKCNLEIVNTSSILDCAASADNKLEVIKENQRMLYREPFTVTIMPNQMIRLNAL